MNDKKYLICAATAVATLIASIFFYGNALRRDGVKATLLSEKQELIVAIDADMPGIFRSEEGLSGYPCEIFGAYADDLGIPLRIVEANSASAARKMLSTGQADMVVGASAHMRRMHSRVPFYSTTFSILAGSEASGAFGEEGDAALFEKLRGSRILISQGFKLSDDYDVFLDSLKGSDIFVSCNDVPEVVEALARGQYDYYVCEQSEARLGASLERSVRYICALDDKIGIDVAFNGTVTGLSEDFEQWLGEYRSGNEYATLAYEYFERGAASLIEGAHGSHIISPYDHVMREVGEREGADWRLMAAIAYSESRFKPDVVSNKGAKGLMQIMPVVARQFGVPDEEVMIPEVNITLAVKLLNRIESMMKIPSGVSDYDRMALVLASYNCGVGHVADARRLAVKYGGDPNSWADVSEFLSKKAEPEYYTDDVVRSGRFRGSGQTLSFVNSVLGRYSSYCTLAAR